VAQRLVPAPVCGATPVRLETPTLCPVHHVEPMTQTWTELPQVYAERTGHSKMYEFTSNVNG